MSDIFKEEARRLCKNGAISTDELSSLLSAYNKRDKSIVKAISDSEVAQQDLLAKYAENRMYRNLRRISNNVVFFFWVFIVMSMLTAILYLVD
jgi:hypothetical protein